MLEREYHIAALIAKQLQNRITKEELEELAKWTAENNENKDFLDRYADQESVLADLRSFYLQDKQEIWEKVQSGTAQKQVRVKTFRLRPWHWASIAAAAVFIIWISTISPFQNKKNGLPIAAGSVDVAAGGSGATLTLSDGKKIRLLDNKQTELALEDGIKAIKSADGELIYSNEASDDHPTSSHYNILSTGKGQTFGLVLPDGSKVWLNSGSRLEYPVSFKGKQSRVVKLEGEAYFEVAKDKKHPFFVNGSSQQVQVLGTRFNINSYPEEQAVSTTLVEGSIRLLSGQQQRLLLPGEQAINSGSTIKVVKAKIEDVLDWRSGEFFFDNTNFAAAFRKLERWYNVEFIYDSQVSQDMLAGGWISMKNNLSAVLALIERSGQVTFRKEGRKIYVYKQ